MKMPTKIGHFEILGELAKSPASVVYKANDPESGQTIALKAIQLSAFGEQAPALERALVAEAEAAKVLSSPNITGVFGAGEIEGMFCAGMDYVQGNSIATMLARKEGFSIWDLLDIGRQLCGGLEHAKSHNIVHYSLEPAKIMCGWDGTVRILGFGVSGVGNFIQCISDGIPPALYYMSPEQVQSQPTDTRSNLFSLGAIFYEMVTERRPFDGNDAQSIRQSIVESAPVAPLHVNPKVHPLLSDLIMKALAKDPTQRYQTGRELLNDLENCKEARPAKKAEAPKPSAVSVKPNPDAQAKFIGASAPVRPAAKPVPAPPAKAISAAAGAGGSQVSSPKTPQHHTAPSASEPPSPQMSAAVSDEPLFDTFESQQSASAPKIAVDPLMQEGGSNSGSGTAFSDIAELPPLKEVYVAPEPKPAPEEPEFVAPVTKVVRPTRRVDDKPKVQPREVAQKAIKEIKGVPPKLMMYSIAAAVGLILVIGIGVMVYVHTQNGDIDSGSRRPAPVAQTQPQPPVTLPVQQPEVPPATQPAETPAAPDQTAAASDTEEPAATPRARTPKKKAAPVLGQITVESTPEGALIQFDGAGDASWVTPLALTNLQPGQHTLTLSKAGYSSESRTVNVAAGISGTTMIHLAKLTAMLVVKSNPPGASIFVDGRDMGTKTPGQISVDKGQHTVMVRMAGYIDEAMSGQFTLGQTFSFSPNLRALGNADSIRTVGKMSKLFGGKGQGQGVVSIHTQPKGAQIAINEHLVEKASPVDVALDPGNYVIDITVSGYAPIRKVVTVEKGAKTVLDEVMQAQ